MHCYCTARFLLGVMLLLVVFAPSFAATAQDAEPLLLAITIVRSTPVTAIRVGNRSVQAIVSTGGGGIALTEDVIRGAGGIEVGGEREWPDTHWDEHRFRQFKVPVLEIGGRVFHDVLVARAPPRPAGDAPPALNIIGQEFISRYLAVIDYASFSITLWPAGSEAAVTAACGDRPIPMERTKEPGLAVSEFTTPSGVLRLLWATAASYSALPEALAKKGGRELFARGRTSFYRAAGLSAAGQEFGPLEFVVFPGELPKDFQGVLGGNFFTEHVVCLDYEKREVRVRQVSRASDSSESQ